MNTLDLSRWQFGITTVYHFIFVPLTIGLAPLVAIMQTAWYVTGSERWLRATKFFGKLLLINFAMGVVTGIVQEFQFGMILEQRTRASSATSSARHWRWRAWPRSSSNRCSSACGSSAGTGCPGRCTWPRSGSPPSG